MEEVLLQIADKIMKEYNESLELVLVGDPTVKNPKLALPMETVFSNGFDPLEGGIQFNIGAFKVFSGWVEVSPMDQVVATEYDLKGL